MCLEIVGCRTFENIGALDKVQCGFRKGRSTIDHLVRFETFVRDALVDGDQVVSVLFDLEKAYDTTWKYGILRDLKDLGFSGHLPIFISNFLLLIVCVIHCKVLNNHFFLNLSKKLYNQSQINNCLSLQPIWKKYLSFVICGASFLFCSYHLTYDRRKCC